jgi:SAM-dependent methyltransferase
MEEVGVRKIYLPGRVAGSEVGYWEAQWEGVDLSSLLPKIRPSSGPLWMLLDRLTAPSDLVLEAGCGSAVVVAYLDGLGRRVIGLDRALGALVTAKRQAPRLELIAGDLTRLPFGTSSFDRVISLGAVEHLERGAVGALVEHHRVLKPRGSLLITVPRVGPLKRWNDFLNLTLRGRHGYRARGRIVTRAERHREPPPAATFHQYEYPRRAFRTILEQAGFTVRWIRPFMVAPGLGESRLIVRLASRRGGARPEHGDLEAPSAGGPEHSHGAPPPPSGPGLTGFLRDAVLHERGRGVAGEALTRIAQWAFGHMDLALAIKPPPTRPGGL